MDRCYNTYYFTFYLFYGQKTCRLGTVNFTFIAGHNGTAELRKATLWDILTPICGFQEQVYYTRHLLLYYQRSLLRLTRLSGLRFHGHRSRICSRACSWCTDERRKTWPESREKDFRLLNVLIENKIDILEIKITIIVIF